MLTIVAGRHSLRLGDFERLRKTIGLEVVEGLLNARLYECEARLSLFGCCRSHDRCYCDDRLPSRETKCSESRTPKGNQIA